MKFFLTMCVLALAAMSAFGQAVVEEETREDKTFTQIDPGFNGVTLESSYDDVIARLGKPFKETNNKEMDECTGGFSRTLSYDGLEIEMDINTEYPSKSSISSIDVTSPKWVMNSGIKVGTGMKKVAGTYRIGGKPAKNHASEPNEIVYEVLQKYGPGVVAFTFEKGKLVKISVGMTVC